MASATIPTAEAPERVNSIGRIFGVLFSPKATFESIARRPTWIVPVLLLCALALCIVGVYGHRAGWRGLIEKQMSNNSQFQELPAAEQERRIEIGMKVAQPVVYAEAVIFPFVFALFFGGLFWVIFNMAVGAKFGFKTSLAIVSYAATPAILGSLVGLLILFLKDPSTIDLQNVVASNVAAFLSSDSPKWLVALLRGFDLFIFWEMALCAIGYNAAAPKKISFAKAFGWILGVWFVFALIRVGFAAAFS
jgi:hypothetical protein